MCHHLKLTDIFNCIATNAKHLKKVLQKQNISSATPTLLLFSKTLFASRKLLRNNDKLLATHHPHMKSSKINLQK